MKNVVAAAPAIGCGNGGGANEAVKEYFYV
jgi:hypothetical protein